jgi:hypothetical protein
MIHTNTHNEFLKHAKPGQVIIELGDQIMDIGAETQFMRSDEYYRWKYGLTIYSIDIHGKNRVKQLDLSKVQNFGADSESADIVTDFGTIEHVSDLYNALLNTHNLCKVGGIMIHSNPKEGTYEGHGHHFFTQNFWHDIAKKAGYEVISIYEQKPYSEENKDVEVVAVFKKLKNEFPTREELNIK